MGNNKENQYAAPEQNLGYLYQSHFALYHLLSLPESTSVAIEKEDDIVFSDEAKLSLGSMKHKKEGDRLTNLDLDFWKSVRIWLVTYENEGRCSSTVLFFLFTTAMVASDSFLNMFNVNSNSVPIDVNTVEVAASKSKSQIIKDVKVKLDLLSFDEKIDFLSRIQIFDNSPRIENIHLLITEKHFRSIAIKYREAVYERLLGWWEGQIIRLLTKSRTSGISGFEVSDKLSSLASEINESNLPIDFRDAVPSDDQFKTFKKMLFVKQLEEIDESSKSIRNAILDYYRAYEQRSTWVRKDFIIKDDEIKKYESWIVDEWERFKEIALYDLPEDASEEHLKQIGHAIFKWAQIESDYIKIREKVTTGYVRRGSFHILANITPLPRIYWHPLFLDRLSEILEG